MAFGEPRLDRADDIAAIISESKERIYIVASRQRMSLTSADVAELEQVLANLDWLRAQVLTLRAQVSADYQTRIGRR